MIGYQIYGGMEVWGVQQVSRGKMLIESKSIFVRKTPSLNNLGSYGIKTLVYIKPIVVDGQIYHSIHAADGTPLTVIAERDEAFALVRQNEMEPASVH